MCLWHYAIFSINLLNYRCREKEKMSIYEEKNNIMPLIIRCHLAIIPTRNLGPKCIDS